MKTASHLHWLLICLALGLGGQTRAALPQKTKEKVHKAALRTNLDPNLVLAIVEAESNYDPKAKSRVGAEGLMQLMPKTAGSLAVPNSFHILSNVTGGCEYFRRLLTEFQSVELALAAYNAGPANVKKYGGIPPFKETRRYVKKVIAIYKRNRLENTGKL